MGDSWVRRELSTERQARAPEEGALPARVPVGGVPRAGVRDALKGRVSGGAAASLEPSPGRRSLRSLRWCFCAGSGRAVGSPCRQTPWAPVVAQPQAENLGTRGTGRGPDLHGASLVSGEDHGPRRASR